MRKSSNPHKIWVYRTHQNVHTVKKTTVTVLSLIKYPSFIHVLLHSDFMCHFRSDIRVEWKTSFPLFSVIYKSPQYYERQILSRDYWIKRYIIIIPERLKKWIIVHRISNVEWLAIFHIVACKSKSLANTLFVANNHGFQAYLILNQWKSVVYFHLSWKCVLCQFLYDHRIPARIIQNEWRHIWIVTNDEKWTDKRITNAKLVLISLVVQRRKQQLYLSSRKCQVTVMERKW